MGACGIGYSPAGVSRGSLIIGRGDHERSESTTSTSAACRGGSVKDDRPNELTAALERAPNSSYAQGRGTLLAVPFRRCGLIALLLIPAPRIAVRERTEEEVEPSRARRRCRAESDGAWKRPGNISTNEARCGLRPGASAERGTVLAGAGAAPALGLRFWLETAIRPRYG